VLGYIKMKKAQIKMTETIAILFIFFLLVLFGMIFYSRIQSSSLEKAQEEDVALKAIQIAQKVSFFPEIQCIKREAQMDYGCIDIYKLESFNEILNTGPNQLYYFQIFEYSHVYVEQIYPENKTWEVYDLKKAKYKGELKIPVPIALFDPIKNQKTFGILHINAYI